MKATFDTYELCKILLGFMSYVFMKVLYENSYFCDFENYEKYYLNSYFGIGKLCGKLFKIRIFEIWNLWKILLKNLRVFCKENCLRKCL
jgi:hypothetical protein